MERFKGVLLIISGAMLWGATGPLMEYILESSRMTVPFMLTIRLLGAGVMILSILVITKKPILSIWKSKYWSWQLGIYSIFGMLGVQYSFVATIDVSNAVFATLLQFLGPIFIVILVSIKLRTWPPKYQIFGIVGTFIGLFLLLTNASFEKLLVSNEALVWGVILGITFAMYTLYPTVLMKEWGVLIVVGWAMIIGGILLSIITSIWNSNEWVLLFREDVLFLMAVLIFFGTIAFILFLSSMNFISPILTSILSTVEPLTAMIISFAVFHTTLDIWQILGVFIMLICVTWLSIAGGKVDIQKNDCPSINLK